MAINAPRGTQDILPSQSEKWQFIEAVCRRVAALYGYSEIRTPMFEALELFLRGVGDTTDVVQKEMFEVKAQKGTDIFALKPEGTAGTVRAVIQNGLLNDSLPQKLYYITSCFRHEKPQAGRLREFHQFGCEMFGSKSPSADAEAMAMVFHLFGFLGLNGIELNINSIGCKTCRAEYHKALKEYFGGHIDELCDTCKDRLERNPMRLLDCKSPECQKIAKDAPVVIDYLCDECSDHFEGVKKRLSVMGIPFSINPRIVRGLDYYTKTVFEFVSTEIGAQGTVCGGGRYDGLVEEFGGKPTPALGFAMGIERLMLLMEAQGIKNESDNVTELYIGSMGETASETAFALSNKLRLLGHTVSCDLMDRSVKAQMKYANKIGAKMSVIIGESELQAQKASFKNMDNGETTETMLTDEAVSKLLTDAMLARETDSLCGLDSNELMKKLGEAFSGLSDK